LTELIATETTAARSSSSTVEVDLVNTTLVTIDLGALIAAEYGSQSLETLKEENVADSDCEWHWRYRARYL